MPQLENVRHEKFARLVAAGEPASKAYVDAGYAASTDRSAESAGSRLLSNVEVASRIAEIRAELERAAQKAATVTKEWIVEKLRENVLRAMQVQSVTDSKGRPIGEYTYQGNVANRALELLGKEIGMFIERTENLNKNVDAPPADASDAVAHIRRILERHERRGARGAVEGDVGRGGGSSPRVTH